MFKSEKVAMAVLEQAVKVELNTEVITPRRPQPKRAAAKRSTPRKVSISVTASEGLAVCLGLTRGWIVELSGKGSKRTRRFRSPGGHLVDTLEQALHYSQSGEEPTSQESTDELAKEQTEEALQKQHKHQQKQQQKQQKQKQQKQPRKRKLSEAAGAKIAENADSASAPARRPRTGLKQEKEEEEEQEEEKEEEQEQDEEDNEAHEREEEVAAASGEERVQKSNDEEEEAEEDSRDAVPRKNDEEEKDEQEEEGGQETEEQKGEKEGEGEEEEEEEQGQMQTCESNESKGEQEAQTEEESDQQNNTKNNRSKSKKQAQSGTSTPKTKREKVKKERVKTEPRVKSEQLLNANGERKVVPVAKSRLVKQQIGAPKLGRPTLAEQETRAAEQAISADPNAVLATREELQKQANELLPLLKEHGFGAAPVLLGVSGSSFGRVLSTQLRGLFVKMPKPIGGRECYQKVRQSAVGVSLDNVYIVWSAKLARWQIVDRLRKAFTQAFARSPVDYRRPALQSLEGTWLVQLESYWYEDNLCQLYSLTDNSA
eukprot:CAMPEP_0206443968 /NCGR_PEP_ID=MMETSP0324_2-20121206/14659_1 /ASSEMBLY_ACC=CAM_ASM_000836 /TAXON_ID=2866 /ORGANISM="Crypthecodinium cohnii, Strain Seligo" /LENGTH=542 /DNA_ID=CAMNT_0053911955 /DNA_START=99 /DNA_END=1727 /DNA_ORIENTATION=+